MAASTHLTELAALLFFIHKYGTLSSLFRIIHFYSET